jgi:hypothetical protein
VLRLDAVFIRKLQSGVKPPHSKNKGAAAKRTAPLIVATHKCVV